MTTTTVIIPATELITVDPMASVDMVSWSCRICAEHHGTATTRPEAHAASVHHLTTAHRAEIR